MSIEKEKQLSRMNEARLAEHLLDQMGPSLEQKKAEVITRMKASFRNGGEDLKTQLLCDTAVLVALDDIEDELRAKIRRGRTAQKEIENG